MILSNLRELERISREFVFGYLAISLISIWNAESGSGPFHYYHQTSIEIRTNILGTPIQRL